MTHFIGICSSFPGKYSISKYYGIRIRTNALINDSIIHRNRKRVTFSLNDEESMDKLLLL